MSEYSTVDDEIVSLRQQLEAAQQRVAAYEGALNLYMKALNKMAKGGTTDAYCKARDNLEKVYKQQRVK